MVTHRQRQQHHTQDKRERPQVKVCLTTNCVDLKTEDDRLQSSVEDIAPRGQQANPTILQVICSTKKVLLQKSNFARKRRIGNGYCTKMGSKTEGCIWIYTAFQSKELVTLFNFLLSRPSIISELQHNKIKNNLILN